MIVLQKPIPMKPPIAQSFTSKDEAHKTTGSLKMNSVVVVFLKICENFRADIFQNAI